MPKVGQTPPELRVAAVMVWESLTREDTKCLLTSKGPRLQIAISHKTINYLQRFLSNYFKTLKRVQHVLKEPYLPQNYLCIGENLFNIKAETYHFNLICVKSKS